MFERFSQDARTLVVHATEHARRLGHRYVGGEHILLAAVSTSVGQCGHACSGRHTGTGRGGDRPPRRAGRGGRPVRPLDRDALATIGIDLDAVRARIEASFGRRRSPAPPRRRREPRRRPGPRPPRLVRNWRRRRRARRMMAAHAPGPRPPAATGRYRAPGPPPSGHIPFTPAAKKILELTVREASP